MLAPARELLEHAQRCCGRLPVSLDDLGRVDANAKESFGLREQLACKRAAGESEGNCENNRGRIWLYLRR